MVMDWREMAGRATVRGVHGEDRWSSYSWAWIGGKRVGYGLREDRWDGRTDPMRGWIIAFCWIIACSAEFVVLILRSMNATHNTVFQYLLLICAHSATSANT